MYQRDLVGGGKVYNSCEIKGLAQYAVADPVRRFGYVGCGSYEHAFIGPFGRYRPA